MLLGQLCDRMRWIVHSWPNAKVGDQSFGSTVHIIRMILDIYPDGTIFHADEVAEWEQAFNKYCKRAAKMLRADENFDDYIAQVLADLKVVMENASHVTSREKWEEQRDRCILEEDAIYKWRVAFRKQFKADRAAERMRYET